MGVELSEARKILNRLARADRVHQKEAGTSFLLRGCKFVLAFVLAAFTLDVALHLASGWRLTLVLVLAAGIALLLAASAYVAYVRRNRLEHVARLLETREPAFGSRLINLLQLQTQTTDASLNPITRRLAQLAVDDYAARLMDVDFYRVARSGEVRRQLQRAAWAGLVFVALLAGFFRVTAVEVLRFADPLGDHPPFSFTHLAVLEPGPDGAQVVYGKSLIIKARASGHRPREAYLTAHPPGAPDQAVTLPMFDKGSGNFHQQLERIDRDLVVFAHTKDGFSRSRMTRIRVILAPQLEESSVIITPPAYTGLPVEQKADAFKGVQALAGSTLQFRLRSNRPLREGLLELSGGEHPLTRVPLGTNTANAVAGQFIAEHSGRLRVELVDADGIPSSTRWEGALTVTHDLPPEVRIADPEKDCLVARDVKLDLAIEASDDYGLATLRLHRGLNGVYSAPRVIRYALGTRTARETIPLDLPALGVQPGDILSCFAEVSDTAPEPHVARSQTVRLQVISVEEYNNYLREQTDLADVASKYAAAHEDLQALLEQQQQLAKDAEALREQLARTDPAQAPEHARDLDRLLARQNELNQQLNQHAARMDQFVRDQPVYDVESDLRELLNQQAENIRQSTATNQARTGEIAQRSAPPNAPREVTPEMLQQFSAEARDQLARLGGVQEATEKNVLDALDDLSQMQELMKDFNQFEALYRVQEELAGQTRAYNRPGPLSREDQLALKSTAGTEQQVGQRLQELETKLRADADAAEKLFPKAAKSGRDLAAQIAERRFQQQARNASTAMLAGQGDQSHQRSERLRQEMESLFSDCQDSGNCPSQGELDSFLALQRGFKPGNNFAQMARSRKFGQPGSGEGTGVGTGTGLAGTSGYAVIDGSSLNVLGGEPAPRSGQENGRRARDRGQGPSGQPGDSAMTGVERPDVMKDLNPVNRQSGAVQSESLMEEYRDLVEHYFEALTTRAKP